MSEIREITKDTMVCDVVDISPEMEEVLISFGLSCCGCPGANVETLEQAAEGHDADLGAMLADLNAKLKEQLSQK